MKYNQFQLIQNQVNSFAYLPKSIQIAIALLEDGDFSGLLTGFHHVSNVMIV